MAFKPVGVDENGKFAPRITKALSAIFRRSDLANVRDRHNLKSGTTPAFIKHPENPLVTADDGAFSTIYWPWVLKVSPGNYRMYYSTDHDPEAGNLGGIGMMTSPTAFGPWTDAGMIYRDTLSGNETETPSVLYVPDLDPVRPYFMYYQQKSVGVAQSTLLAKSANGITDWVRVGKVIDVPSATETHTDGHTGYARVDRIGNLIVARHLMGGGPYGRGGLSYSTDGVNFHTDPRPLQGLQSGNGTLKTAVTSFNIVEIDGNPWYVGGATAYGGSGAEALVGQLAYAPLSKDLRSFLAPPTLVPLDAAWEDNYAGAYAFVDDGQIVVYYVSNGAIGAATLEVYS
jgi:hypothetical protein